MSEKQQKLVLAIIDFLNHSIEDGTVKQDDREGLEVAGQSMQAISFIYITLTKDYSPMHWRGVRCRSQ